jgi:signal peptidase II
MASLAIIILLLDQITKLAVILWLPRGQEWVILDGFFKFVNWENTGAAWSMFSNNNFLLALVSVAALGGLLYWRDRFETKTVLGQLCLGIVIGGIVGNLVDRLFRTHVVDFLRFFLYRRNGEEIGFPAFNVADSAICVGVGVLVILSWVEESRKTANA